MFKNLLIYFFVILLVSLPFLVAGCGLQDSGADSLKAHQRQWTNLGIENYRYQLQVGCFCPPDVTGPVIIEVRDGITRLVVNSATGIAVEGTSFNNSDTIEDIFLIIENAFKREADEMTVTYDERYGFPTQIKIDFIKQAADDEITYSITQFQVIN